MEKQYTHEQLLEIMNDKKWYIRYDAAARIDISYLPNMINDEHWAVRLNVAKRIDKSYLTGMFVREKHNFVIELIMNRLKE